VTQQRLFTWAALAALLLAFCTPAALADDGSGSAEAQPAGTQPDETGPTTQPQPDPADTEVDDDDASDEPDAEEDEGELEVLFGLHGQRTEHYIIYSQLSAETTRDLGHRLEAMYDYFARRFKAVYCPIEFPKVVVFFNNREDFVAAGGHPNMPGQFMGGHDGHGARLMMLFHEGSIGAFMSSCPLMYHEGFHQFKGIEISQAGNINRQWPLWLDESYATTFNNITWTGDGWVDGHARLENADAAIKNKDSFIPLRKLVKIDGATWHRLTTAGKIWPIYMQGWSLIFFLNHADGGRHRPLLDQYILEVSTGKDSKATLRKIVALQPKYARWFNKKFGLWTTGAKYYEIFVGLATSHLARAHARGQRFRSGKDFLNKAKARRLRLPAPGEDQWLPDSLRQELLWYHKFLTRSFKPYKLEIVYPKKGGAPKIRASQPRFGLVMEGSFQLDDDGNVTSVDVDYTQCPSIDLARAKKIVGTKD
jgi:hypothetical protein